MSKHRQNFKQYQNGKHDFITSFKVLENGNFDIVLLENCPCDSKEQLHARERYYIETLDCVNKCIPNKYNEIGKSEYGKQYHITNRENILLQKSQKHICVCGGKYTSSHRSEHLKSSKHQKYINQNMKAIE